MKRIAIIVAMQSEFELVSNILENAEKKLSPEKFQSFADAFNLLDLSDPDSIKEFSEYLSKNLEELCDKQIYDISQANFKGYDTLFQQKLKWYRRIEQRLKKIEPKNSGV